MFSMVQTVSSPHQVQTTVFPISAEAEEGVGLGELDARIGPLTAGIAFESDKVFLRAWTRVTLKRIYQSDFYYHI